MVEYLKQIDLLTVPYGKGQEFSVRKRKTYDNKLQEVLKFQQFTEIQNDIDSLILKKISVLHCSKKEIRTDK